MTSTDLTATTDSVAEASTPDNKGATKPPRVGVFGWGIVAPKSPNIEAFAHNLAKSESWLTPFEGFGPSNFLVGEPEFRFEDYKRWIDDRFAPRHYQNLKEKMDSPSLYAIGAFIQALEQNPGLEKLMHELGGQAHVYIGTGLGSVETMYQSSVGLYLAQQRWNRFWGSRENNSALSAYLDGKLKGLEDVPLNPAEADGDLDLMELSLAWEAYWMERSPELREYLDEAAAIDSLTMGSSNVEQGKLNIIRERGKRHVRLQEKWGAPEPPWKVSANLIWNIHNTPASQVSILGKITGLAFAPVADPVARKFVDGLVARLNWTGQISFDFRRDAQGELHVIECNPRTTSGVHYFGPADGLDKAILEGRDARASSTAPMTLPLAMLAYGLPDAIRNRGFAQWRRDFAGMQDISVWPGDRGLLLSQLRALGEIAVRALRNGTGLLEASVRDIEWDGEPLA